MKKFFLEIKDLTSFSIDLNKFVGDKIVSQVDRFKAQNPNAAQHEFIYEVMDPMLWISLSSVMQLVISLGIDPKEIIKSVSLYLDDPRVQEYAKNIKSSLNIAATKIGSDPLDISGTLDLSKKTADKDVGYEFDLNIPINTKRDNSIN